MFHNKCKHLTNVIFFFALFLSFTLFTTSKCGREYVHISIAIDNILLACTTPFTRFWRTLVTATFREFNFQSFCLSNVRAFNRFFFSLVLFATSLVNTDSMRFHCVRYGFFSFQKHFKINLKCSIQMVMVMVLFRQQHFGTSEKIELRVLQNIWMFAFICVAFGIQWFVAFSRDITCMHYAHQFQSLCCCKNIEI